MGDGGDQATRRTDLRLLLAAWAAYALLRLVMARSHAVVGIDEALYFSYGDSWLRTGTYSGIQWPVTYPLLISLLAKLTGARAAIDLTFALLGSLTIVPIFLALRELRGSVVARWGLAVVALLPAISAVSLKSGTHSLFLPLLGLGFLLHVRVLSSPTVPRLLALGGVLGFAYVTRTDGLLFLGIVPVSLLFAPRESRFTRRLGSAALVALAGMVVALPNVLHIHHHTGKWQASAAVSSILQHPLILKGVKDDGLRATIQEFREGDAGPLERITRHPGLFLRRVGFNARQALRMFGDMYGLTLPIVALAGLGIARLLSGGGRLAFLCLTWATPPLAFLSLHVEARYFSPTSLFLGLLAAEGCVVLSESLGERGLQRFRLPIFLGLAASLLVMSALTIVGLRSVEEHAVPGKAEVARRMLGERLPTTWVDNPQVRFLLDGQRGSEKSAPVTQRDHAPWLLFDGTNEDHDERPLLERQRAAGVVLVETAREGDLVLYARQWPPPRD